MSYHQFISRKQINLIEEAERVYETIYSRGPKRKE